MLLSYALARGLLRPQISRDTECFELGFLFLMTAVKGVKMAGPPMSGTINYKFWLNTQFWNKTIRKVTKPNDEKLYSFLVKFG